jgi:hypothetical protein
MGKMMRSKEEGGLGFKDLYSFNLAMLACQGLCILQAPESLCSRVLRAKYFTDGDLLCAKPVAGMSYVWCSILKGIEVLKKGLIWRIGDGTNVHIREDPWVPNGDNMKPCSMQGN